MQARPAVPARDDIELYADDLLHEFAVEQPPVPVEEIAQGYNLWVEKVPISRRSGISGLLWSIKGITGVQIRQQESPQRQRYTLAHELGHHVMFPQVVEDGHLHPLEAKRGRSDPLERACEYFAACLLMPRRLVLKAAEDIRVLGTLEPADLLNEMAKKFLVSQSAMRIRFAELGLALA